MAKLNELLQALDQLDQPDPAPSSEPVAPISQEDQAIRDAVANNKFDPASYAAGYEEGTPDYELAKRVYQSRAAQGTGEKAARAWDNFSIKAALGGVKDFGVGLVKTPARLIKQGYQEATGSPNAPTTTAENVMAAQMAGLKTEAMGRAIDPVAPRNNQFANTYFDALRKNPEHLSSEIKKVRGDIDDYLAFLNTNGFSRDEQAQIEDHLGRELEILQKGGYITQTEEEDPHGIHSVLNFAANRARNADAARAALNQPGAKIGNEMAAAQQKQFELDKAFASEVENARGQMKLNAGRPLDKGLMADYVRASTGANPSEIISPEALQSIGAAPVDTDTIRQVSSAIDPANLLLAKAPSFPGASRVGGAITEAITRPVAWAAENVAKAAEKAATPISLLELAGGNYAAAARAAIAAAAAPALKKVGAIIGNIADIGKQARTGGVFTAPVTSKLAQAARSGAISKTAKSEWVQNLIGNTSVAAASIPVAMAPVNAALSGGLNGNFDAEKFVSSELNAPFFGLLAGTQGIKPQLVEAIRPTLRAEGRALLTSDTSANGVKSLAFIDAMPEAQKNSILETAGFLQGLEGTDTQGGKTKAQIYILPNAEYQASKAQYGLPSGTSERGYFWGDGSIYINGEHSQASGIGHTLGHEAGGHIGMTILRAISDKNGPLSKQLMAAARNELGTTKGGRWTPGKDFQRFVDSYNAALPAGMAKIAVDSPAAFEEFLAETSGQMFSQKGAASFIIPDGVRDKISSGASKVLGKLLGADPRIMGGGTHFDRTENAKINSAFTDAMMRIADVRYRPKSSDVEYNPGGLTSAGTPVAPSRSPATPPLVPPSPALGTPANAPQAPTSPVSPPTAPNTAPARQNVQKALVALKVPAREAAALAQAAQGADESEMLRDALRRRTPGRVAPPQGALATKPAPAVRAPALAETPEPAAPESSDPTKTEAAPAPPEPAKPEPAPSAPEPARDTAAEDAAIEQQVAAAAKTKEERLPQLLQLTTERAGGDPRLLQKRTDKRGKVTYSGRLNFDLPEHRALIRELGLTPQEAQKIQDAQEAKGAKYVDYWSASKEPGTEGDISGKQRRAEYAADQKKASRDTLQKNKAIVFTNAAITPGGQILQRGLSVDKFLANAAKLIDAAKEHKIPVDYHGINDPQLQQDLDGYIQNHQNGYKGDGSGPVKGETPTEGYEPYQIPRNRFDLLNAAFHNEASTGQSRYEAKVKAHEGALARGEKSRKPPLRAETKENADEAQAMARENDWQVDDETGDTNPFRAMLNREGKLTHPGKGGALRQGTQEVLEPVWETLSPDMIDAIRDHPQGDRDIVRDVGYTGEPKGVFGKGLPDFKKVGAGFMPEMREGPEKTKAIKEKRAIYWTEPKPYTMGYYGQRRGGPEFNSAEFPTELEARAELAKLRAKGWNAGLYGWQEVDLGFGGGAFEDAVIATLDAAANGKQPTKEQKEQILDYLKANYSKDSTAADVDGFLKHLAGNKKQGSFMPEAKGALSRDIVSNDPTEIARAHGIKYDGVPQQDENKRLPKKRGALEMAP